MARGPHPLRLATSSAVDAAIIIISDDFLVGQHHYGTFPHRICLKHNEAMCLASTPLPTTATAAYASKDSVGWMKKVGDARLRLAAGEQKQEAKGEEPPH
jgi:hypothetical protein